MAHFAKINSNNIVEEVVVVPDEQEHRGEDYLNELGLEGKWIQTSYNKKIRNIYAYRGAVYVPELDIFVNSKRYDSWTLDEDLLDWRPPVEEPEYDPETQRIEWNEESLSWSIVEIDSEEI